MRMWIGRVGMKGRKNERRKDRDNGMKGISKLAHWYIEDGRKIQMKGGREGRQEKIMKRKGRRNE